MSDPTSTKSDGVQVFKDAEAFLADLGIERRPIVVPLTEEDAAGEAETGTGAGVERAPVSQAEAVRIATELAPDEEAVKAALLTVIRSTKAAPASEGRLTARLIERGHSETVVAEVMRRARRERIVDDDALAAALVAEWRAVGHAARRMRDSLRKRGFAESTIDLAVAEIEDEDPYAAAFDLAVSRARALAHLPAETAYRRVVGFIARRGHPEAIARRAARDAVYDARDQDRITGH